MNSVFLIFKDARRLRTHLIEIRTSIYTGFLRELFIITATVQLVGSTPVVLIKIKCNFSHEQLNVEMNEP